MSVDKNTYGIVGFNLTSIKDKLLNEEVCESDWYENLRCYQRVGNIQIFDDPMRGNYLYFGYIFFESGDEYEDAMSSIVLSDINHISQEVKNVLKKYFNIEDEPKVMVFHEYT